MISEQYKQIYGGGLGQSNSKSKDQHIMSSLKKV